MHQHKRTRTEELKIQASILHKDLRSGDRQQQAKAANRFLVLPFLQGKKITDIIADLSFYQLKHAYAVLAAEHGCKDWNELKTILLREDYFLLFSSSAFLNAWFNNYEEAKAYQQQQGGYLLQCRKDFMVCEEAYIASAGLGGMEAAWQATGYDWVRPASPQAWKIIYQKAKDLYAHWQPAAPTPVDKSKRPAWLNG